MDTVSAFGRAVAAQGHRVRVFDWDEAARRIVSSGARSASAGLGGEATEGESAGG